MFAEKTRVEMAREAFLKKDASLSEMVHSKKLIDASFRHREQHKANFSLPEIILGGQDGLVNVLGVILGVAAATNDSRIVMIAGLAATFAESVSMAAVAYTSTVAEADYYQSEYEREKWEIEHMPQSETEEIRMLYKRYGFTGKLLEDVVSTITADKKIWLNVMMQQELNLEPVDRKEALVKGFIVGASALVGSFIPLVPYMIVSVGNATILALVISSTTLFVVGYYKAKVTLGRNLFRQGIEMFVIGMLSAIVGYFIGTLFKI